tara:strand:+ start:312 stop:566 length:255 start_codon:yes stop_codon:yes gene_type:complete
MLCNLREASQLLGYSSRTTLIRLIQSGALSEYTQIIDGRTFLDMRRKGNRPTLARKVRSLIGYKAGVDIIDFDPEQWLKDQSPN